MDENYAEDVHAPAEVSRRGGEVSDPRWKMMSAVSSVPAVHARRMKAMSELGATAVAVVHVSGADPHATLRIYGEDVPAKRRGP